MADRAIPPQTAKIGSLVDIQDSEDPEGLRVFYYLVQDLKVSDGEPTCSYTSAHAPAFATSVLDLLLDLPSLQDQAYLAVY